MAESKGLRAFIEVKDECGRRRVRELLNFAA